MPSEPAMAVSTAMRILRSELQLNSFISVKVIGSWVIGYRLWGACLAGILSHTDLTELTEFISLSTELKREFKRVFCKSLRSCWPSGGGTSVACAKTVKSV